MEQVDRQYEFHRLALAWPQHRWWRPLLTALLGFVFYTVFVLVVLVTGVVLAALSPTGIEPYSDALTVLDLGNPVTFAFTLVSLILMIPALALAVLITGPRPIGLLSSVAGRIRWRWLAVCAGAALAVSLAGLAVSVGIGLLFPAEAVPEPVQQDTTYLPLMLALTLLAVPFQAAAEEYVFRGFLMQAIGTWLRHPAFAILLPVPLFVLGHTYDPFGQITVALFAVVFGWLSWRTGGLEAAIAAHAINNMTVFGLGALGLVDVNSSEGSVGGLVVSALTMGATAAVIVRLADRRGIERTRTVAPQPLLQPVGPSPVYAPAGVGDQGPAWAPFQVPATSWSGAYDPSQYDSSRYAPAPGTAPAPSYARPTAPPEPQPQPYRQPKPQPTAGAHAPAAPGAGRDHSTDRHPSGPAHPAGPGHPSGTPHPAGPGHPGAAGHRAD